jgi:hypothetical protein
LNYDGGVIRILLILASHFDLDGKRAYIELGLAYIKCPATCRPLGMPSTTRRHVKAIAGGSWEEDKVTRGLYGRRRGYGSE